MSITILNNNHDINLQELNLSKKQLESLPSEIYKLINLQKLYLRYNSLSSLSVEIGRLGNLQELYLYCNYLISLPNSVGKLTNLKKLKPSDFLFRPFERMQYQNLNKHYFKLDTGLYQPLFEIK